MEEKIPIEVLIEIVEKYKLGPGRIFTNPEIDEMLGGIEDPEGRIRVLKHLPIFKLLEIVKEFESGKIKKEDLEVNIRERLEVDQFLSEKIAREILEELGKREEMIEEKPTEKEEEIELEEEKPSRDIYREPIE